MEKTSCIQHEPLTKLDEDGQASILNYNLPQSTTYEVVSYIQLDIDEKLFKDKELKEPPGNYWQKFDVEVDSNRLNVDMLSSVLTGKNYTSLNEVQNVGLNMVSSVPSTSAGIAFKAGNIPVTTKSTDVSVEYLSNKIYEGYRPVVYKRPSGKQGLKFAPRPKRPTPSLFLVMHMRVASYLGDYGAGQTLSTFSLLPGEKTVIEIIDYRHREDTRSSSESILDSYSTSSMDDLQTTIEESTEQNESSSETDTDSMSADMGVSGGINLGIVKLGADVSGSVSSVNTTTEAVSSQVNTLNSAVNHHVQTADTQRQIEINTDVTSTETTENTTTTTRTLENLNRSRVLNFVGRQLLQEFYTLTYLDDVSLYYSNGYPESKKTGTLSSLENLLKSVLVSEQAVKQVENQIYVQLCGIPDSTGTKVGFIEKVTEKATNCINPGAGEKNVSYVRKRKDLVQKYKDKTVNGIILDVTHRVLRTPSVIIDALMGQGESLDCYNQQLQEAAFTGQHLSNQKTEQAIAIINAIEDPEVKARLYNNVFGSCCGTSQAEDDTVEPA